MLHDPRLLDVLERLIAPSRWEGTVWRRTIGDRHPLTPNARGARWNPPGVDALYCSLSPKGADVEVAGMLARQPVATSMPLRTTALVVSLAKVADVRDAEALDALGFGQVALTADAWTAAQVVGAAAAWLGIAGLIVPSGRHEDGNMVVFVNNIGPGDQVDVVPAGDPV